jgi:hypothetical protein
MGSIQEPNASLENLNDPDNPHLGAEQADIMSPLILKRAKASRSSGEWRDDDYDVLENGVVVGRIVLEPAAPAGRQWGWASGYNGDIKRARDGYEPTREAAMAAFAKSWRLA